MSSRTKPEGPTELSFGGVVVRGQPPEVVTIVPHKRRTLALPKGGANPDERPEETALREVREETGITARIREPLGEVHYTYRRGGRTIEKTVRYFLCEYVSGTTDDHDHEVDEARWMPLGEAVRRLTFPGERRMVRMAASRLARERPDR